MEQFTCLEEFFHNNALYRFSQGFVREKSHENYWTASKNVVIIAESVEIRLCPIAAALP
jgi:hypothetical protein